MTNCWTCLEVKIPEHILAHTYTHKIHRRVPGHIPGHPECTDSQTRHGTPPLSCMSLNTHSSLFCLVPLIIHLFYALQFFVVLYLFSSVLCGTVKCGTACIEQ